MTDKNKTKSSVKALSEGGVMVALAMALSYVKLFELPNGGSISLGMLPIFFYCVRWGWKYGFLASAVYGILQLTFDGAYAWGPWSMLLDYLLAFTALGVAGFFKKANGGIFLGTIAGSVCRFIFHFISGITIYRIYAPTELLNRTYSDPYLYSLIYNGSYMFIDMLACLLVFAVVYKPLRRYILGEDIAASN